MEPQSSVHTILQTMSTDLQELKKVLEEIVEEKETCISKEKNKKKKNRTSSDPRNRKKNFSDPLKFKKRSGTTDVGKDYENFFVAILILKLIQINHSISDFKISANDENFGHFDDVVLDIEEQDKTVKKYALQLKHQNKTKKLNVNCLKADKGAFSLKEYCHSLTDDEDTQTVLFPYQLILATNLTFDLPTDNKIELNSDGQKIIVEVTEVDEIPLLKLTKKTKCYKFRISDDLDNKQCSNETYNYKKFFENFYLYTNQPNLSEIKKEIERQINDTFSCDTNILETFFDKYQKFIFGWSLQEGKKEKLYKEKMQQIMILCLVSPFVCPLTSCDVNNNRKLLQRVISKFDIAIFDKTLIENVKKLWGNIWKEKMDEEKINKCNRKFIIYSRTHHIEKIEELLEEERAKFLWVMEETPLILNEVDQISNAIQLCNFKSNFVLFEKPNQSIVEKYQIFQNLSDVTDPNDVKELTLNFKCLLLGKEISLNSLLQDYKALQDNITTDVLVCMVDHSYEIEEHESVKKEENLSSSYIKRSLSRNFIDVKFLNNVNNKTLIVINNFNNNKCVKIDISRSDIIYVEKRHFNNISTENTLIFSKLPESTTVHLLQVVDEKLEWIGTKGNISELEAYRLSYKSIDEPDLLTKLFKNKLNIIADDPGMGKSTLLRSLKKQFSSKCLTILLSPKDISAFCSSVQQAQQIQENEFENFVIDLKFAIKRDFDRNILKHLINKGKVIFLWDALDELSKKNFKLITEFILKISTKVVTQWVSCRRHLKKVLENKFQVLSRNIIKLNKEQQTNYIENFELNQNQLEALRKVIAKLEKNALSSTSKNILGIPLQLSMLTELFKDDCNTYSYMDKKLNLIIDIYSYFIEFKFKVFNKKAEIDNTTNNFRAWLTRNHSTHQMKCYQEAALKTIFGDNFVRQLNITSDEFLKEIDTNGDKVGLITNVVDGQAQFAHYTYAEYFAATYLKENLKKIPDLKNIIFKEKFTNIRFFFDMMLARESPAHIAILYQNLEELKTCKEYLDRKDLAGRNTLQVACSWGERCPLLEVEKQHQHYVLDEQSIYNDKAEKAYQQLLNFIFDEVNPADVDAKCDIFTMNAFEYAGKSESLFIIALLSRRFNIQLENEHLIYNLIYYAVKHAREDIYNFLKNKDHVLNGQEQKWLFLACQNGYEKFTECLIQFGVDINSLDQDGRTPLYIAALNENPKIFNLLMKHKANVNGEDMNGNTLLHTACQNGHKIVVNLLIQNKCSFNKLNKDNRTALHVAFRNKHYELTKMLINSGAKLNIPDKNGNIILHLVCAQNHKELLDILIKQTDDINVINSKKFTPLHLTCVNGHEKLASFLIKHGANIRAFDQNGNTPLHIAYLTRHQSVVKELISCGPYINVANKDGNTLLHLAVEKQDTNMVSLLVEEGANINASNEKICTPLHSAVYLNMEIKNHDGDTVLHCAIKTKNRNIISLLIQSGADVNATNRDGWTPLHVVCKENDKRLVILLIELNANLEVTEKDGWTPLYITSTYGHYDIAKILIESGANIHCADKFGWTALHNACYKGKYNVAKLLVESKADVNAVDQDGWTPICSASYGGYANIVELLINSGADINVRDKDDWTPLRGARRYGQDDVVSLLLSAGAEE